MKFEKITEEMYRKYWEENGNQIESTHQKETRIKYFKEELPLPKRSTAMSAGYDFVLPVDVYIKAGEDAEIPTGIKVKLDDDKHLDILPRSSYGIGKKLIECTTIGVVDADYYCNPKNDGHILVYFWNRGKEDVHLKKGDRFVQGIIRQYFLVEGDEYGKGAKRVGGSGSTGMEALPMSIEEAEEVIRAKNYQETVDAAKEVLEDTSEPIDGEKYLADLDEQIKNNTKGYKNDKHKNRANK